MTEGQHGVDSTELVTVSLSRWVVSSQVFTYTLVHTNYFIITNNFYYEIICTYKSGHELNLRLAIKDFLAMRTPSWLTYLFKFV